MKFQRSIKHLAAGMCIVEAGVRLDEIASTPAILIMSGAISARESLLENQLHLLVAVC
jgi:hypothetical protein